MKERGPGRKTNSHEITSSTEKAAAAVVFVVGAVVVVVVLVLRSYNSRRATSDMRKARWPDRQVGTIASPTTLLSLRRGRRRVVVLFVVVGGEARGGKRI